MALAEGRIGLEGAAEALFGPAQLDVAVEVGEADLPIGAQALGERLERLPTGDPNEPTPAAIR